MPLQHSPPKVSENTISAAEESSSSANTASAAMRNMGKTSTSSGNTASAASSIGNPEEHSVEKEKSESTESEQTPKKRSQKFAFPECPCCKQIGKLEKHFLIRCPNLMRLSYKDRHIKLYELKLCYNCFSTKHKVVNCDKNPKCTICVGNHHTLLHPKGGKEALRKPSVNKKADNKGSFQKKTSPKEGSKGTR
jgi:hypothetical protein